MTYFDTRNIETLAENVSKLGYDTDEKTPIVNMVVINAVVSVVDMIERYYDQLREDLIEDPFVLEDCDDVDPHRVVDMLCCEGHVVEILHALAPNDDWSGGIPDRGPHSELRERVAQLFFDHFN